jgi:hypothetical protein
LIESQGRLAIAAAGATIDDDFVRMLRDDRRR